MKKLTLMVDGMMCGMCEAHVNDAVRKAATVKKVTSSHTSGQTVVIAEDDVDVLAIRAAIEEQGYAVSDVKEEEYKAGGIIKRLFKK